MPVTDGTTNLDPYITGFSVYERRPAWYAPAPVGGNVFEIPLVNDDEDAWDEQIARDAAQGKLDGFRQEAIDALRSGTVEDL